jgi:hypothetical protein
MMRTDPAWWVSMQTIGAHPVISRARLAMERMFADAKAVSLSHLRFSSIGYTIHRTKPHSSVTFKQIV